MKRVIKYSILIFVLCISLYTKGQNQKMDTNFLFIDTLSFQQKLDFIETQNRNGFEIDFFNIDTINQKTDISINFFFSKKATKLIAEESNAKNKDYTVSYHPKKDTKWKYNTTVIYKNVQLYWNPESHSFISIDSSFINSDAFEYFDFESCLIEIKPEKYSNDIHIYFAYYYYHNYYFNYQGRLYRLFFTSLNKKTMYCITESRPDKRKLRIKKGQYRYCYNITTKVFYLRFLRHFKGKSSYYLRSTNKQI